jgi:hypothetical protein
LEIKLTCHAVGIEKASPDPVFISAFGFPPRFFPLIATAKPEYR